jgi:hypothetical protein
MIRKIYIQNSSIETLDKNLLEWKKLDVIDIRKNPANCNPAVRFSYFLK